MLSTEPAFSSAFHLNRDLGDNTVAPSSAAVSECIMLQTVFDRLGWLTGFLPRSCIGSPYARIDGDRWELADGAASADGDHDGWY